jgi:hypothetical protein
MSVFLTCLSLRLIIASLLSPLCGADKGAVGERQRAIFKSGLEVHRRLP